MKLSKENIIAIIGILIAIVIPLYIYFCTKNYTEITIAIIDVDTGKHIPGAVYIDDDKNPTGISPETGTTLFLEKGSHTIRTTSEGYHPQIIALDRIPKTLEIKMDPIAVITDGPRILSFDGWSSWSDEIMLNVDDRNTNEITINGRIQDAAGFFSPDMSTTLQGNTLVLYFSNTASSNFSQNRMVRLAYNINDTTLLPVIEPTKLGGYIVNRDTPLDNGIEYKIPDNFDGKLTFVFYQAELSDLKITAYYK